jgi:hypothetical protein
MPLRQKPDALNGPVACRGEGAENLANPSGSVLHQKMPANTRGMVGDAGGTDTGRLEP